MPVIDDPRFSAGPTFGKLAVGGRWEQAVVFQPSGFAGPDDVRSHLGGSEEVACEAFFGQAFFGVRVYGPRIADFVVSFARAMGSGGPAFFRAMSDLGVVLEEDFRFAELGAEGAWDSVGPLHIDDPCAADPDVLWADVMDSRIGQDRRYDKALEFTYAGGLAHWLALPVSEAGTISQVMVQEALQAFCQ